jgi:hypothetical protein
MKTEIKGRKRAVHGVNFWHSYRRPKRTIFIDYRAYVEKKPVDIKGLCLSKDYLESPECIIYDPKAKGWAFVSTPIEEINDIDVEKRMYEANKEFYLKNYEGKYVAIQNQEVLDSDTEFSKIAERVYSKYGYKPIFIPLVIKEEPGLKLRSPRFK